ncbi:MAG: DUF1697 domain-containing protein [Actinomycetota bacterium]|nr:DUF1697 domain-containing protein [Actinomycetota bacterium]
MRSYVALLRGIGPSHPNMHNEKLREFFEGLGFGNVRTVISTGNVLFESNSAAMRAMEAKIEEALPKRLGFSSTTIVRSRQQLQALVDEDPFEGIEHSGKTNLNVTFLKTKPRTKLTFPHRPEGRDYTILGLYDREVCSVIDLTGARTPDLMRWLEKEFGKEITTRTYKTVGRILSKLDRG